MGLPKNEGKWSASMKKVFDGRPFILLYSFGACILLKRAKGTFG